MRWVLCLAFVACSSATPQSGESSTGAETSSEASTSTSESTSSSGWDESSSSTDGSTGGTDLPLTCESECSTLTSNTCPQGQKCSVSLCETEDYTVNVNICVDVQGDKQEGEVCEFLGQGLDGEDTCGEGLICWDEEYVTGLGTCVAFCEGSRQDPTCADGTLCRVRDFVVILCHRECDPFASTCRANEVCVPEGDRGFICSLSGWGDLAPYATPCGHIEGCSPGLLCIDSARVPEPECVGLPSCCSPVCDLSLPNTCPGVGQACEPYFPIASVPVGYESVGVCAVGMP